jgi:rRNA-processing protein FCF1
MKNELHALYIKHDGQFKTLSKIALSQLILKIVYLKNDGCTSKYIEAELGSVLASRVSTKEVEDAVRLLKNNKKLSFKNGRYFIHSNYKNQLSEEVESSHQLLRKILDKYFSKAESDKVDVESWFKDTVVQFFEKYSFEWFHQIAYRGKNSSSVVPNLTEIIDQTLSAKKEIRQADHDWLKRQFLKFIDSDEADDNLLFWYYGISMFSARLITARNFADSETIEMFKDSKFILDTNVLMILDLEEHELSNSLNSLERILSQLNISTVYLYNTREEYIRAMDWRRVETIKLFDNYNLKVLQSSDCPFIKTALRRACYNSDDVKQMFDKMMDIPTIFNQTLSVKIYDFPELGEAISRGASDEALKEKIQQTYRKLTGRDKRDRPVSHDAGLIEGAKEIRKTEKCWVVTNDSTLKRFALEHGIRDEHEIAVGLDVVLGLMAVNGGGVDVDSSNFAPLFKNLVKYSLVPESDAFEMKDLAFILRTRIKINELPNEKVIEVAKEVKKLRVSGADEENIALYLRRFMEGDTVGMVKQVEEAVSAAGIAKAQREFAERERDRVFEVLWNKRRAELMDKYNTELIVNRCLLFGIPIVVAVITYLTIRFGIDSENKSIQYVVGLGVELMVTLIGFFPLNRRIRRRYSDYKLGIDNLVGNEIRELRNQN